MEQQSDGTLVTLAQAGDRQVFGMLIERHRPMLVRLIDSRTNDPQWTSDIVQEAVLQAYLSLTTLRERSRFRPWLCGIALNIWRTQMRRGVTLPLEVVATISEPSLDELAERIEARRMLLAAIIQLSPANRDAVDLFYLSGLDLRETAAALGVSVGAVKARLHKARLHLRSLLQADQPARATDTVKGDITMLPVQLVDVLMTKINRGENDKATLFQLILMHEGSRRAFEIWVGEPEGMAIVTQMNQLPQKRPQTYALASRLLAAAQAQVESIVVNRIEADIYYATVNISGPAGTQAVDSRPSDAIALALHTGAPLFVRGDVLDQAGFDVPANARPERRGLSEIMNALGQMAEADAAHASRIQAKAADVRTRDMQVERERVLSTVFGITPTT